MSSIKSTPSVERLFTPEVSEPMSLPEKCYIGVDVGSGSVRAALVSEAGKVVSTSVHEIRTWSPQENFYEQSSEDVWNACCTVIKEVTKTVPPDLIRGIGFDATCSLVAIGKDGKPVTTSPDGSDEQNIIMWMDHRASKEADFINSTKHSMLAYVGGTISLEMQLPKLLWLKKNLPETCWEKAGYFFDLPDFLTWKATGDDSRSLCSVVCKWNYEVKSDGRKMGWNEDFLHTIGLEELQEDNWNKIGREVNPPGTPIAKGLSPFAADLLELPPGIPVGASLIDSYAGTVGVLGCNLEGQESAEFTKRLGIIAGTSSCHLVINKEPIFVPGVWGPYYGAMLDGYWVTEGGQSASGLLLEFLIEKHPAVEELKAKLGLKSLHTISKTKFSSHVSAMLLETLQQMAEQRGVKSLAHLTQELHVWPDFHGNRSPLADVTLKGMISGMTLLTTVQEIACLYLSIIQSLAYGTRHILETMEAAGHKISAVIICGGLRKNPLYVQTHADVLGLPVLLPYELESVLVGAAMMGAMASKDFDSMEDVVVQMSGSGEVIKPNKDDWEFHEKKYKVYMTMVEDQQKYRRIME